MMKAVDCKPQHTKFCDSINNNEDIKLNKNNVNNVTSSSQKFRGKLFTIANF